MRPVQHWIQRGSCPQWPASCNAQCSVTWYSAKKKKGIIYITPKKLQVSFESNHLSSTEIHCKNNTVVPKTFMASQLLQILFQSRSTKCSSN